jgi:sulfatase maturation enzyme AslB (radical SAM superfamily)
LREEAFFVEIIYADVSCSKFGYSFNDGNRVGQVARQPATSTPRYSRCVRSTSARQKSAQPCRRCKFTS